MGDSCSIYLFCSIYRSASIGIHRSENNLFVFLTLGLWCKGNFLLFTVIFLLKTDFALTAWEAKLSFFWWLVVLPYLEAELIKTFRGPFSVIPLFVQELQCCREVTMGSDSAWCSPAFQGQEELWRPSILLDIKGKRPPHWYPFCKRPLATGVMDSGTTMWTVTANILNKGEWLESVSSCSLLVLLMKAASFGQQVRWWPLPTRPQECLGTREAGGVRMWGTCD